MSLKVKDTAALFNSNISTVTILLGLSSTISEMFALYTAHVTTRVTFNSPSLLLRHSKSSQFVGNHVHCSTEIREHVSSY